MLLQESRDNVGAECEGDTAVVFAPAGDVLVGVRPEQIAEKTAVGDLGLMLAARKRIKEGNFNLRRSGA